LRGGEKPSRVNVPEFKITRDMIAETVTESYKCGVGAGVNRGSFTVSKKNPAEAVNEGTVEFFVPIPGGEVQMKARCTTVSDEKSFHQITEAEAAITGQRHFHKSWRVRVLRESGVGGKVT